MEDKWQIQFKLIAIQKIQIRIQQIQIAIQQIKISIQQIKINKIELKLFQNKTIFRKQKIKIKEFRIYFWLRRWLK